jgi:phage tail sheath protein FI
MSEFLTPGVFVEETSFRSRSIEGVPTSTLGITGRTLDGNVAEPVLVTSLTDYERTFGGLSWPSGEPILLAQAVRAFFDNGGTRAYVTRIDDAGGVSVSALKAGLDALVPVDDIAIVACPDTVALSPDDQRLAVQNLLDHCQSSRYRFAVVDPPANASVTDVRAFRAQFDSKYGALYFPWVVRTDGGTTTTLPPSGFVAGIFARTDIERGVHKAPTSEVVNGISGLAFDVDLRTQDILNPEGIDVLRSFTGRGIRIWGARTLSTDPEWKYVNLRRLVAYLEHSIDKGTQWAVFEPNDEKLWAAIRRVIEDFLLTTWQSGALLGTTPEQAFFVRCDRTTMTQNDLDNGRLVCVVGVAPVKPAEFVIIRIGQWTADRKDS